MVAETYDEILFSDPSDKFHQMLMAYCPNKESLDPQSTLHMNDSNQQFQNSSSTSVNKNAPQNKQNSKMTGAVMQPVRVFMSSLCDFASLCVLILGALYYFR